MALMKRCYVVGAALAGLSAVSAQQPPAAPALAPPPGAVVLFDGRNTDAWNNPWNVDGGAMVVSRGDTSTKQSFDNFLLHVEFRTPSMPEAKGQARGNSGVFLRNRYEVQVLDSFGIANPGRGDCGAVYDIAAPLVNATRPPLRWQTYDIVFRAARFDADGKKTENARVTVLLNGVVVQNNTEIPKVTGGSQDADESKPGPIRLQDHGNRVAYRNIWVLPLPATGANHY